MSQGSEANADSARVTQLLRQWGGGDLEAREALLPIVYDTLRRLARHYLADERHAGTLQPTALVHEAYLRLVDQRAPEWEGRSHFYGVAAHLMRQVLVDHARRRLSAKRGGDAVRIELTEIADLPAPAAVIDLLALDAALDELARVDDRKSRAVELRYFGGCSEAEIADALGISVATVRRDLRAAEAWLGVRLGENS